MITPASAQSPAGLQAGYHPPPDAFDEMQTPAGRLRPNWENLVPRLETLGAERLRERRDAAQSLLREHGVTYNAFADGRSAERTWELDILPMLIGPEEWARLEAGLIQRARLLNAVLGDFYGAQRLFHDGLLPPALLHANPGFLRPCYGARPPGDRFLTLHAVDLSRAPDGQWWVFTDRTQAPSGLGYALENRIVVSRLMPDEFRAGNVQRVASFFIQHKAGLQAIAPWTESPNIVLLTPGQLAETYFEHVYLARYLGYPLVEGSDLTVRAGRVFIKTIEGLRPVDVIIRRVDDTFCDPLELRADSFLGVPGLIEATRTGRVAISNALGSGAVEAPALLAFLPKLARHLLGEELRIPNVATWWCGQARERAYTLENLDSLVIKRAFVARHSGPAFGEHLDSAQLRELAARIAANPHAFVGQERVPLSTAPVWTGSRLEPRPLILRCYVAATEDGYAVLPGGLTRVSASAESSIISSQVGAGSKDTWILSELPVEDITLLDARGAPAKPARLMPSVASRTVENLFWLGRYAERLEDTTRLARVALGRLAGEGGPLEAAEFAVVMQILVNLEKLPPHAGGSASPAASAEGLRQLIFASGEHGTLRELLDRVAFLTATVRDRLSADTWRILNQLQTEFPPEPAELIPGTALLALHRVIFQLGAFSGMEMENMTRGHAWRFMDIGRRIERAGNLTATVRAALAADPAGVLALPPLLEYSDSAMTYRRRHVALPDLPTTLKLLLAEPANPRSLAFQIKSLRKHFTMLPGDALDVAERRRFGELHALHASADFAALGTRAAAGDPHPLDALLGRLVLVCDELSDVLSQHYFSHVLPRVH